MPDRGDVVIEIKIAAAFGIEHPDAFGALHPQRLLIEQHRSRTERPQTALDGVLQRGIHRGQVAAVKGVQRQDFLFPVHRAPSLTGAGRHRGVDRDYTARLPPTAWINVALSTIIKRLPATTRRSVSHEPHDSTETVHKIRRLYNKSGVGCAEFRHPGAQKYGSLPHN